MNSSNIKIRWDKVFYLSLYNLHGFVQIEIIKKFFIQIKIMLFRFWLISRSFLSLKEMFRVFFFIGEKEDDLSIDKERAHKEFIRNSKKI